MTDHSDLIRRLVIPMVRERSREPGDAWHQAEQALSSQSLSLSEAREEIERLTKERDEAAALAAAQNDGNRFASAEWTKTLLKLRDAQKERDAILAAGEALSLALSRYGFPMSDEAWRNTGDGASVNSQASVEARTLHRASVAFFQVISGAADVR